MPLDTQAVLDEIDRVLNIWDAAKQKAKYNDFSDLPDEDTDELIVLMLATVERLAPPGSTYRASTADVPPSGGRVRYRPGFLNRLRATLRALRADYAAGYLRSVNELIHADMFADFLEMAEYLLEERYKDPSAVIVGSVLEEHLRNLCDQQSILTTKPDGSAKKADALNSELAGSGVYSKLDQKSVTAWLDLRNKAAHGLYGEYTADQVQLLAQGVRDFITRLPA